MEIRFIFVAALIAVILHLTSGAPAYGQSKVDSLRELMREQATERAERGQTADLEVLITEEANREVSRARRTGRSSNIQIRRGDTSGVDQEQLGEGNHQSVNVGAGD